jgi:hypothetical protein
MDGAVRTTRGARRYVVKVHERVSSYQVERECYRRLAARHTVYLQGHALPMMIGADDALGVLELTIVSPPYVLDFGKARLDSPLEAFWPEHVLDERWAHWESLFEPWQWPKVLAIYDELADRFGIWLEDLRPENIAFGPRPPDHP